METPTSILQGLHKGWWMWCHWISRMPIYMCQFCPAGDIFSLHPGTRQGSLLFINGKVLLFGPATTPRSFTKLTCICKDASCIHTVMTPSMLRCLPTRQPTQNLTLRWHFRLGLCKPPEVDPHPISGDAPSQGFD